MAKPEGDIQSRLLELAAEAISAFCEDISGMFGVAIESTVQAPCRETVGDLQRRFKRLTAVNSVNAEGMMNGTFYVVYDQGGLFTLAGVVVMLPENRIKEVIRQGSKEEAQRMSDAIAELGNMMVGTWDRVFREALRRRHRHFKQAGTFIGKPWENPKDVLGMGADEEFLFIPATMTVESYPEFSCGVVFPPTVLAGGSEAGPSPEPAESVAEAERSDTAAESGAADGESPADRAAGTAAQDDAPQEAGGENTPVEAAVDENSESAAEPPVDESVEQPQAVNGADDAAAEANTAEEAPGGDAGDENMTAGEAAEEAAPAECTRDETDSAPVAEAPEPQINVRPQTVRTGGDARPAATAQQIMQKDVAWLGPNDTVQDALNTMQRHETGYVMIGDGGVLEGIVSRSDVAGAVSPYLRPVFAKWKRPLDDATLQIRLSWVMTRPVRTITPHTPLDVIVDTMLHFGGRCLPVVDAGGTVQGLVTAFDIFKVITTGRGISQTGRMPQAALPA